MTLRARSEATSFAAALKQLDDAPSAVALFGPLPVAGPSQVSAEARRAYRRLARVLHPDSNTIGRPSRQAAATDAFARLSQMWTTYAQAAGAAPTGSADAPTHAARSAQAEATIQTRRTTYTLHGTTARGDLANLYRATATPTATFPASDLADVVLKLVRNPRNSDLVANEAAVLAQLRAQVSRGPDARHIAYLPELLTSFRHRDRTSGLERQVNVLAPLDGFVSLREVRNRIGSGIDPRDAAWMWRRLLVACGLAHRNGVTHAAVVPEHVLIHPAQHGLVLVDWSYASTGAPLVARVPAYRDWYPREVEQRRPPGPGTDIAMTARTMTWLIGDRMPADLADFAAACARPDARGGPGDAWAWLRQLDQRLERLYGPRTFRPFRVPEHAPS